MLTATSIDPHPVLRGFIKKYMVCKSEADLSMTFPLYATHESCLSFFVGNTSVEIGIADGKSKAEKVGKLLLFGLSAQYKGQMKSVGTFHTFTIEFRPNGFYKIFGIPASEICNNTFTAGEVLGNGVAFFYEQLVNASSIEEVRLFADAFLIGSLNKQKRSYTNEGITKISSHFLHNCAASVTEYASLANMSLRNFERRFGEQVGVSPKLYHRLVRFDAALTCKMNHPRKSWTIVAYECGYFDSMHMIKEFKQFSQASPSALSNNNPGFTKGECYKVFPT